MLNRLNENKKVVDDGLKLYPNLIRMQCSDAEDALNKEMEKLDRVLESIDRFAIDNSNSGKAIDAVKAHLNEYKLVITAQKSACEGDIFDYRKFKEDVKSEILLGDEINEKYRYAAHMYNENMEKAESYMKKYQDGISPCMTLYYNQSKDYENLAMVYKRQAAVWEEKGQELTEINALTADPITTSKALKTKVKSGLSALGRAFDGNTFKSCIGSEWINGINSDMKNMAQKMAIGNGDLEGKSDAEIARVCKKPYADMTALEKMEWQNIENYIVNCNIDSKKKVDFINLVLKSCTLKKGRLANSAITEYEFNDKILKITGSLKNKIDKFKDNASNMHIRNMVMWRYLISTSSVCGVPQISLEDIGPEGKKVKKCIELSVVDKTYFMSPHYVIDKQKITIFPVHNLRELDELKYIINDYLYAEANRIKPLKAGFEKTADAATSVGVGFVDKYNISGILMNGKEGYDEAKNTQMVLYKAADYVENIHDIRKNLCNYNTGCKCIIVGLERDNPQMEVVTQIKGENIIKEVLKGENDEAVSEK